MAKYGSFKYSTRKYGILITSRIWLGISGSETLLIVTGRKLTENDVMVTQDRRTLSGKLVRDIVDTKKYFRFTYDLTTNAVVEELESIYLLDTTLNLKIERKNDTTDNYAVRMNPIQRSRINAIGSWLHTVSVELTEI